MNCCSYGIMRFQREYAIISIGMSFVFLCELSPLSYQAFGKTCCCLETALLHTLSNHLLLFLFTVKYKLPSALFSSHLKINNLWSALEGFPGEGLEVPEACGLHPSPEVSIKWVLHFFPTISENG